MRFPDPNKILKKISEANHIYTEMVTLHFITKTDCPDCGFDPVRHESVNPNCKTCGGSGFIEQDNPITIPVSFENPSSLDDVETLAIGEYKADRILITIDRKELEQYNIDIHKVRYFTHDGVDYVLDKAQEEYLNGVKYEVVCELVRRR